MTAALASPEIPCCPDGNRHILFDTPRCAAGPAWSTFLFSLRLGLLSGRSWCVNAGTSPQGNTGEFWPLGPGSAAASHYFLLLSALPARSGVWLVLHGAVRHADS